MTPGRPNGLAVARGKRWCPVSVRCPTVSVLFGEMSLMFGAWPFSQLRAGMGRGVLIAPVVGPGESFGEVWGPV